MLHLEWRAIYDQYGERGLKEGVPDGKGNVKGGKYRFNNNALEIFAEDSSHLRRELSDPRALVRGIRAAAAVDAAAAQAAHAVLWQADGRRPRAHLLDSPGAIKRFPEAAQPRNIIRTATEAGVGVLGIRAVQAGALTQAIDRALPEDHPEELDYHRAAPFRALCETWNLDPADVAHQYALAMDGIDTVILGVKNREELLNTIQAANQPLTAAQIEAIDALGLRLS